MQCREVLFKDNTDTGSRNHERAFLTALYRTNNHNNFDLKWLGNKGEIFYFRELGISPKERGGKRTHPNTSRSSSATQFCPIR